jgi:hypothetical protein
MHVQPSMLGRTYHFATFKAVLVASLVRTPHTVFYLRKMRAYGLSGDPDVLGKVSVLFEFFSDL